MPQFREKSAAQASFSVGLMTYPVLQAADILLYDADLVPVGEDQRQHLELARDLAQRFNQRFGETFVVPEGTYGEIGAKIMDLQDPTSRMSTSLSAELGVVKVLDPPDTIRRKLRSAVTDSGREVVRAEDKPGITNLIEIMAVATGDSPRPSRPVSTAPATASSRRRWASRWSSSSIRSACATGSCAGIPTGCVRSSRRARRRRMRSLRPRSRVHERVVGFVPP